MSVIRATDRLFFAAIPDRPTAGRITEVRQDLCDRCGLTGKPVAMERLHVTEWHVGDGLDAPPPDLIDELVRRVSGIEMPPFRVMFDHAMSFSHGPFVLGGREGVAGLEMLHEHLKAALFVDGMKPVRSTFTPHMTLLRAKRLVQPLEIEPITWMVKELVLVHSLLGRGIHRYVARIPLRRRD
jgi:2'-5' RNA ligase